MPFDAGVVDAEARVPQHAGRGHGERRDQHLALGADRFAEDHQRGERDREVIGVALLIAKRAGLEPHHILEEPGAQDGGHAAGRDHNRGGRDRPGADEARPALGCQTRRLAYSFAHWFVPGQVCGGLVARSRFTSHATFRDRARAQAAPPAGISIASYGAAVDPPPWAAMIRAALPLWRNW